MNKIQTQLTQTMFDIAIQETGSVESLFDIIALNNFTEIPLELPVELYVPSPIQPKIVEYLRTKFRQNGSLPISIATSGTTYTGWFLPVTVNLNGVQLGTGESGQTLEFNLVNQDGDAVSYDIDGNDIVVPNSPVSTGNTALPMKTGAVSNIIGDDGDTQYGRLVNFLTLETPNFYGNNRRFTGIGGGHHNGTQYVTVNGTPTTYATAFPNNIVVDHAQKDVVSGDIMMYYNVIAGNQTWNNARLSAIALGVGGFSGWHMTNVNEWFAVRFWGFANGLNHFNYPPFSGNTINGIGIGTHSIWLSTTLSATEACYVFTHVSNFSLLDPTAVGAKFFACRIGNISEL